MEANEDVLEFILLNVAYNFGIPFFAFSLFIHGLYWLMTHFECRSGGHSVTKSF